MVQETEKFRDEDEANESKYESEIGMERSRVTVCNTLTEGNPENSRAVTSHRRLTNDVEHCTTTGAMEFYCFSEFLRMKS